MTFFTSAELFMKICAGTFSTWQLTYFAQLANLRSFERHRKFSILWNINYNDQFWCIGDQLIELRTAPSRVKFRIFGALCYSEDRQEDIFRNCMGSHDHKWAGLDYLTPKKEYKIANIYDLYCPFFLQVYTFPCRRPAPSCAAVTFCFHLLTNKIW